jgi:localization factor PodJL
MLARVSRSESESTESWRRIEEQLRGVSRRLDSSERSQSENNRVLSRTAAEMNVAAREQSQAFDQVSQTIVSINERLERLERERASDGIKDAVKALHQGLSRLADQIGQTANQSATQVTALTQNMDQLAHRLGQLRDDAAHGDQQLGERIAGVDSRIAAVEKTAQFTTNALDHALEKLESQTHQRANDQVEWQRRAGATDEALQRLEDSVMRLERAGSDEGLERRLDGIENNLHGLVARLENHNPAAPLEDSMRALVRRLEALEKDQAELVGEMRANIAPAPAAAPEYAPDAFAAPSYASRTAVEAPPFAEPPAAEEAPFLPPYGTDAFAPEAFAAGEFAEVPDESDDPFAPLGDMAIDPAEPAEENFLAAARRSAREAAEKNETQSTRRFPWSARAEGGARKSRLAVIGVMLGVALLAVAAAMISQRLTHPAAPVSQPASNGGQPFTPAPQVGVPEDQGQPVQDEQQQQGAAGPAPPPQRQAAANAPAPSAPTPVPAAAAPSIDRIAQLANSGNATAQTIIGLRALGANGGAVNPAEAFKWLSLAANQGQAVAQYRLGTLYERGQGVASSTQNAAQWYRKAADQGNRLAMYNLAVALANPARGQPNAPDAADAARWFARAAALGVGDAQYNLAVLYERGLGVPQSLLDAFKWYTIAGAGGDSQAQQRATQISTQLSDADRAAALKSAQGFKPQALSRAANVPPEAADLAGQ